MLGFAPDITIQPRRERRERERERAKTKGEGEAWPHAWEACVGGIGFARPTPGSLLMAGLWSGKWGRGE